MAVNLNSLSLTLDQFNAAASGKYNIGQIKLGENGTSVYRTNNHKTWTILNTTRIGPEEAWAVKEAFCKALSKGGWSRSMSTKSSKSLAYPAARSRR